VKATCIYGPPGTGKTTRLAAMYRDELEFYGADQIRFLSFTKAAARETLHKIEGLKDIGGASTIHSLIYGLIGVDNNQVIDNAKLQEFGNIVGYPLSGGESSYNDISEGDEFLSIYSVSRNTLQAPEAAYNKSTRPGTPSGFKYFIKAYCKWKKSLGYVDFDDMLCGYIDDPPPHPHKVLFIDEAQDLTPLQWGAIDRLCMTVDKVVIAGDDDQAIFEFTGAAAHGMAKFEKKYNAERIILGQSYRIPRTVHAVANKLISQVQRVDKEYHPRNFEGEVVVYGTVDAIEWDDRDTLVLYRTHYVRKDVENHLITHGIPYTVESGAPGIMQSKPMRAIQVWESFNATGLMSPTAKKLVAQYATQRVLDHMEADTLTRIQGLGWSNALHLPENVIGFYGAMARMNGNPNIRLSTIHGAKGREADRVILITTQTQRVIQNEMLNPDAEARVFYVGATRAKEELCIVWGHDGYTIRI